jgi:hypothetical protein
MTILRFVLFVLPLVSLPAPGAADRPFEEMQQWSDQAGRTMQAKLVRVSGTLVHLSLPDGGARVIPLEKFGSADQRRILERMVHDPATLEYSFTLTGARQGDGSWQVKVVNSSGNTLDDLLWTGRFTGGPSSQETGPGQALRRLEPGQEQIITLRPKGVAGAGLQLRLSRKNAVIWEWSTSGPTTSDWPLEPGQVRVPARGQLAAQVLAALARVGSGSGQLGLPGPEPAAQQKPDAVADGEDLVKLFESP